MSDNKNRIESNLSLFSKDKDNKLKQLLENVQFTEIGCDKLFRELFPDASYLGDSIILRRELIKWAREQVYV